MKVERICIRKKGYRKKKEEVRKEMEVSIDIKLSKSIFKTIGRNTELEETVRTIDSWLCLFTFT